MKFDDTNYYDNLKVSRDAPIEVIRAAYRALSKQYHPDSHPQNSANSQLMVAINEAHSVLCDPAKRLEYDRWLDATQSTTSAFNRPNGAFGQPTQEGSFADMEYRRARYDEMASPGRRKPTKRLSGWVSGLIIAGLLVGYYFVFVYKPPQPVEVVVEEENLPPLKRNFAPPSYTPPAADPNGVKWPASAAYLAGTSVSHDDGISVITVDNSFSGSGMHCKLYSMDDSPAVVRQFYVPPHQKFLLERVRSGKYEVRYHDVKNGGYARSKPLVVTEVTKSGRLIPSEIIVTCLTSTNPAFSANSIKPGQF